MLFKITCVQNKNNPFEAMKECITNLHSKFNFIKNKLGELSKKS
jgi:hypothetical protein